jgi:ATP-dependent DNA helicase
MAEFEKWTPSVPVVMYHGKPEEREAIFHKDLSKNLKGGRPTMQFPVVCTSYEMVLRDRHLLSKIKWEFIIIDEGHRMKNFDSKLFRELQTFDSATRLLITGTPLQNNLRELWSLLHFLLPSIFSNWEAFETWFDFGDLEDEEGTEEFIANEQNQDLVKKIHLILQPLLLRRVKADVAHYLPKKREYVLFAPMTREQTDLYNVINDKNIDTRGWLENKVVERLTGAPNTPAASMKTSPVSSRSPSTSFDEERDEKDSPLTSRTRSTRSSAKKPSAEGNGNAFTLMMGRGKPSATTSRAASVASSTRSTKRKAHPTEDESQPKSTKSSRHSTPAPKAAGRGRGRPRKQIVQTVVDGDADSDDDLDDDAFEAKIAEEYAPTDQEELEQALSPEEFERAKTLDLAKKEISAKKLGNPIMQLRLVCNSPHNFYNPWATSDLPVDESIVTSSGKMLLLDRLLPALFKRNHKVLIFSQFKTQLDILQDYLELRDWAFCRIDGSVAQADRSDEIAAFNTDPDVKVFLLSTRAGGQGINLAAADTVILFDSDWNPQQDLQAQDRAHRIGQTRPVIVYRLATKGTVEEVLLGSADAKRRLEKLVIRKGGFKTMGQKMDMKEDLDKETLRALLLKDGEVYKYSGEQEVLSNEDLKVLMDRWVSPSLIVFE